MNPVLSNNYFLTTVMCGATCFPCQSFIPHFTHCIVTLADFSFFLSCCFFRSLSVSFQRRHMDCRTVGIPNRRRHHKLN